jgi:carbamoyl-phosphate synthase large subunit
MNLLFVASGRRVSLLESFQKWKDPEDKLVCVDSNDQVPTRFMADHFHKIYPWSDPEGFTHDVLLTCRKYDVNAIVSLMDPATEILVAKEGDLKKHTDAVLTCTTPKLSLIARSKHKTADFFERYDVKTPRVIDSIEHWLDPVVVRRFDGFGSRGMEILRTQEEKIAFMLRNPRWWGEYVATEWVSGTEYTVDCYKNSSGEVCAIVPRKRIEVRGGEVLKGEVVSNEFLVEEIKKRLLPHMGFMGVICIQAIQRPGERPYFIEINDRFGGGAPLSFAAGAEFAKWLLMDLKGQKVEPLEKLRLVRMYRADREFFEEI